MPHSVSAKKSLRQNQRRRLRNRSRRSFLRTQLKKCETALAGGDVAAATAELIKTAGALDRAAANKLIHRNMAARKKSRLTKRLNAMAGAGSAE